MRGEQINKECDRVRGWINDLKRNSNFKSQFKQSHSVGKFSLNYSNKENLLRGYLNDNSTKMFSKPFDKLKQRMHKRNYTYVGKKYSYRLEGSGGFNKMCSIRDKLNSMHTTFMDGKMKSIFQSKYKR